MKNRIQGEEGIEKLQNKLKANEKQYNIIILPNFTAQKAGCISPYLNLTFAWNTLILFVSFNKYFSKIHAKILNKLKFNGNTLKDWNKAISKLNEEIKLDFEYILPPIEGEFMPVTMNDTYIQEFQKQILELKPIKIIEEEQGTNNVDLNGIENLIGEIKNEVKKGNRVSFKLMQELQSIIEELASNSIDKEIIDDAIKVYEKKVEHFLNLALKAVDSMDLIYQSALKTNLGEWASQIEAVIQDFLQILNSFGIEELQVEGVFFDGETMISIGTVTPDFSTHLERYQVYSVHERGFRFKDSNKLIREAKVITIY